MSPLILWLKTLSNLFAQQLYSHAGYLQAVLLQQINDVFESHLKGQLNQMNNFQPTG